MWFVELCMAALPIMQITHDAGLATFDVKSFDNYMTNWAISHGHSPRS